MPGLDNDELLRLLESRSPAPVAPQQGPRPFQKYADKADEIRAAIYEKHSIPAGTSAEDAIATILKAAGERPDPGFANEQEWMKARREYLGPVKSGHPDGVPFLKADKAKWDESIHVLDPRTYEWQQKYGRDLSFLDSEKVLEARQGGGVDAGELQYQDAMQRDKANQTYANTENQRLARRGVYGNPLAATSGGHADYDGWLNAVANATGNQNTNAGYYLEQYSDRVPAHLRTSWSNPKNAPPPTAGASGPVWWLARALADGDAWRQSGEVKAAGRAFNTGSHTPVADLPSDATGKETGDRIKQLQGAVAATLPASSDARWHRMGYTTPPSILSSGLDMVTDFADPSTGMPITKALLAGRAGMRAAGKAALIGGPGWKQPYVAKALAPIASDAGWDVLTDGGVNAGILASAGGDPGRSWKQFWLGGGDPGKDFPYEPYNAQAVSDARKTLRGATARAAELRAEEQRLRQRGVSATKPLSQYGVEYGGLPATAPRRVQ